MDKRLKYFNKLMSAYGAGDYDKAQRLSSGSAEPDADDIVDTMLAGVQMLGEELNARTISRDYFTGIFNRVTDMVIIVSRKGIIENVNLSARERLGYPDQVLLGRPVDSLLGKGSAPFSRELAVAGGGDGVAVIRDRSFAPAKGPDFPVEIYVWYLAGRGRGRAGQAVLTVRDMTDQLVSENRVLRAMIDTQEKERIRLARDLHDGLGQRLAAIKFMVSSAVRYYRNREVGKKLDWINWKLGELIEESRDICFNLMPKTLEDFGLIYAVRELGGHLVSSGMVELALEASESFPALPRELEIDLFRVVQEFVNNAVGHGKARKIRIVFLADGGQLQVELSDNGKGFNPDPSRGQGMGLRNMETRIRSHDGVFRLASAPGKGTRVLVQVPLR
jgi:PAS domain S-box-containing protein